VVESILNDLFHVFRLETCRNVRQALDIVLLAMTEHMHENQIVIKGSACLYYVASLYYVVCWNFKAKRKILTTLLNGMLQHRDDPTVMRNGCLTLGQFNLPHDALHHYEKLVRVLLCAVSVQHANEEDGFIQRTGIFLLNTLCSQDDQALKQLIGRLDVVQNLLTIVVQKLKERTCDTMMEMTWLTLWNLTDETPENSKRFLDGGGMYLFLKCKERFPEETNLLRNMIGLLGNVAEVAELRNALKTKQFVQEFAYLLDSNSDGIEVSYNAAGVLANMASDGPEAWTLCQPERSHVLDLMVKAINRWDIESSEHHINYRSLESIFRLVRCCHTVECQLWAMWALANLTTVSPDFYCQLVEEEGGFPLVQDIVNKQRKEAEIEPKQEQVMSLALKVRENVLSWKERDKSGLQFRSLNICGACDCSHH